MGTPTIIAGSGVQLSATMSAYYTTPAGSVTIITAASLNNPASRSAQVSMHIVPPGGSASAANQVVTRLSVPAEGEPVLVPALVAQVLPAGYSLHMGSNIGGAVTPMISGNVIAG